MTKTKRQKLKEKIKAKKRKKFIRGESWRYGRLSRSTWRKPRGIEQKMRIKWRGSKGGLPKSPTVGFRTPKEIRGLHPSGYESVRVHNVNELDELKPKYHAIIIASQVGRRKRIDLKAEIKARGFKLLNPGIEKEEILFEMPEDLDMALSDVDESVGELTDIEDVDLTDEDLDDIDLDDIDLEDEDE